MQVPLDWELGAFDGDQSSGYLRLDDMFVPRVEIRWKRSSRYNDINQATERYLKSLQKSKNPLQRQPTPLTLAIDWPNDLQVRCYRWKGQYECVAAVMQCLTCKRISVVQIFFPEGTFSAAVYKRILSSLHDHNPADVAYWDFYLMHVRTPSSWKLLGHKFNPGYAELSFSGPGKLQADFRRWGPASVILQDSDLEQWARENSPQSLKADSIHTHTLDGDLAQITRRNASGLLGPLCRAFGRGPAIRKALYWHGTAWHCPSSERLWMVDVFAGSGPEAAEAEWQVLCHQPTID